MPRTPTDPARTTRPIDWQGWIALAWAAWFGGLYARMVLSERAPGLLNAIGRAIRTSYR